MTPSDITNIILDLLAAADVSLANVPSGAPLVPAQVPLAESVANSPAVNFLLPNEFVTDLASATQAAAILSQTGVCFSRHGTPVYCNDDRFEPILPANLGSLIEQTGASIGVQTEDGFAPKRLSEAIAKRVIASPGFRLPSIQVVSRCPVFKRGDGGLNVVYTYDSELEVYVAGGGIRQDVSFEEAVVLLTRLFDDFLFAATGDLSRAIAQVITPALVMSNLLRGRSPLHIIEADQSQTGKGYLAKMVAAIYNCEPAIVTQRRGGTGSLQNSFDACLRRGTPFISLDNIRGKIDLPGLESFLTESNYTQRPSYDGEVIISAERYIVSLTSNAAEMTVDLANRSSVIRLRKQATGYQFRQFPEGDLLEHVRANQELYLGAVFAVIKAWVANGSPRTDESRHSFRPWAQSLDWIVQNLLGLSPLIDGQFDVVNRVSRPEVAMLRDLAKLVDESGLLDEYLGAAQLFDLADGTEVMERLGFQIRDTATTHQEASAIGVLGKRLKRCFHGENSSIEIDEFVVTTREHVRNSYGTFVNGYCFTKRQTTGSTGSTG